MKLNLIKYFFGVTLEKFLGFMIFDQRIEINLEKIRSVKKMALLRIIKEVQHLIERITALNRFLSRLALFLVFYLH